MMSGAPGRHLAALALAGSVLAVIAWWSPPPDRMTDRDLYEAIARQVIVPDCNELHCFRLLVASTIGVLPGPSIVKWKAYAVAMNAAGAAGVLALSLLWGLSRRAAWMAAFATAFGFGSLYTLHDVFTSDPLMYALGPLLTIALVQERVVVAGLVAAIGVTGKEFAVAPLYMCAAASWMEGRRLLGWRILAAANIGFIVWLTLQLVLIIRFNYNYDNNSSTHLLSGGYLATWIRNLTPPAALTAMLGEFGALWLLAPAGWFLAPRAVRRLALAALPAAAVFAYVQQPDRALWNFHFLVTPLSALVLERVPAALAWSTLGAFAFANLRIGAQLPGVPSAKYALGLSLVLAAVALVLAWRGRGGPEAGGREMVAA